MALTRILIADDHPVFLFGLKSIIGSLENCEIENIAADGETALKLLRDTKPDIAILDIDMPGLNGLEVTKRLHKKKTETKVIILTMHKDESIFNLAFDSGAVGYVLKDNAATDIVNCINSVSNGDSFVSPQINSFYVNRRNELHSNDLKLINNLTESEKIVLKEVSENMSSAEIASKLNVTSKTIQNHRFNICKKMNLEGVNSLLTYALVNKNTIHLILSK